MRKAIAAVVLVIALAIPVGGQNLEFLEVLIKAVVEEYGIETVLDVLEDLGYIGEDEIAVKETATEPEDATDLSPRSPIWDDPNGEEALVYMVVSDDASCYSYIEWGRDSSDSLAERMGWRQEFINRCI